MSKKRDARHFHAGKLRRTVDGVEYVEVAESGGKVFVSKTGVFVTPFNIAYPGFPDRGYLSVKCGGHKTRAHRIVFEVFAHEIPDGLEIDHVNGVKTDNRLCNLRAVTKIENQHNPATRARHVEAARRNVAKAGQVSHKYWRDNAEARARRNEASAKVCRRPVRCYDSSGHLVRTFGSRREAADLMGVCASCITAACKGRQRTAAGYEWRG